MSFSPAQCRAARALLNWSQEELVARAAVSKKTIADFERGATQPRAQTLAQITQAFKVAGIKFVKYSRAKNAVEKDGAGVILESHPKCAPPYALD
jgi:transcriptional regulator with XRE-family HTH domain